MNANLILINIICIIGNAINEVLQSRVFNNAIRETNNKLDTQNKIELMKQALVGSTVEFEITTKTSNGRAFHNITRINSID